MDFTALNEISQELYDYFANRYGNDLILSDVNYSISFKKNDSNVLEIEQKFNIRVHFDYNSNLSGYELSSPTYSSKHSFEKAAQNAIRRITVCADLMLEEKEMEKYDSPDKDITILLNTSYEKLTINDYKVLIKYYADREEYNKANYYHKKFIKYHG